MSNTNDLIRRGDAIDAVYSRIKQIGYENNVNVLSIRQAVREVPTAQPERKKGEWVKTIKHYEDDDMEFDFYAIKCSACGEKPEKAYHLTRYCPNCGADLRGDSDE